MINLKYKLVDENSKEPVYSTKGDACFDLFCREINKTKDYIEYRLGVKFEIPKGYVGLLFPRSSITNKDLIVKNSVGIIDETFRGEITLRCLDIGVQTENQYSKDSKCAQMLIIKNEKINLIKSESLSNTIRGEKGYGHSGE